MNAPRPPGLPPDPPDRPAVSAGPGGAGQPAGGDELPPPPPIRGRDWAVLGVLVIAVMGLMTWWQDRQAAAEGPAIAALAKPGDIRMISSVTCIYCTRAREWLQKHQVAHSECLIERDAACLAEYQALGGPGTPTLVVRGQAQRGFSPPAVRARLEEAAAPAPRGGG